jgi:ectoine hydroxylase-related dioxygenase (phytanoyl-CoA dioxygenase family)
MLTQEQIDRFHAEGFLIMRGVIRGEELARLQRAADDVQAQGIARIDAQSHRYATGPNGETVYWRSEEMWQRGDIWKAVTVHPDLLENIGQCVGQAFYPWNDSLVVKLPNAGASVQWHQDPPYNDPARESTYPVPNFTTDIYLDHSGLDNGCVYAIPGHHLVGHVDIEGLTPEQLIGEHGAVPLEMEAGDVLFHCLSTPHGSGPNLSSTQRRIFYVHYLADEVFQDGYGDAPWASEKPGWGPRRRELITSMLDARTALGFDNPLARSTLKLGDDGFEFTGAPTTPIRHWGTLAGMIPPDQRAVLRRLDRDRVEASV